MMVRLTNKAHFSLLTFFRWSIWFAEMKTFPFVHQLNRRYTVEIQSQNRFWWLSQTFQTTLLVLIFIFIVIYVWQEKNTIKSSKYAYVSIWNAQIVGFWLSVTQATKSNSFDCDPSSIVRFCFFLSPVLFFFFHIQNVILFLSIQRFDLFFRCNFLDFEQIKISISNPLFLQLTWVSDACEARQNVNKKTNSFYISLRKKCELLCCYQCTDFIYYIFVSFFLMKWISKSNINIYEIFVVFGIARKIAWKRKSLQFGCCCGVIYVKNQRRGSDIVGWAIGQKRKTQ